MPYYNRTVISKPSIPGLFIWPLLALWVSFSCSRVFGIYLIEGLPQITIERVIFCIILTIAVINISMQHISLRPVCSSEIILWLITIIATLSGILYGGFESRYAGAGINILLNFLLLPAILFSIILRTDYTRNNLSRFFIILTAFGAYLGLMAILERTSLSWLVIPNEIVNPKIIQHWGRSRGPFLQAEFNGAVMVQLIPVSIFLATYREGIHRIFGIITAVLLCIGTYLTDTRAALLSLIIILSIGVIIRGYQRIKYLIFLTIIFVGGITAYLFGATLVPRLGDINPIQDRIKLLSVTLDMISKHYFTGVGFGNFDLLQIKYFDPRSLIVMKFTEGDLWAGGTHNTLLTPVAELGIVVGGIFLFLIFRIIFVAIVSVKSYKLRDQDEKRGILVCSLLICLAFFVNALFVELRYTLTPNALFWIFYAVIEKNRLLRNNLALKIL